MHLINVRASMKWDNQQISFLSIFVLIAQKNNSVPEVLCEYDFKHWIGAIFNRFNYLWCFAFVIMNVRSRIQRAYRNQPSPQVCFISLKTSSFFFEPRSIDVVMHYLCLGNVFNSTGYKREIKTEGVTKSATNKHTNCCTLCFAFKSLIKYDYGLLNA